MKKLRLFIAVELPETWQKRISLSIRTLAGRYPGVRWIPAENIHLTLKFLGDTDPGQVTAVQSFLDAAAGRYLPITARSGGFGVFPNLKKPRVIWLGLPAGKNELTALVEALDRGLTNLGFEPEKREFTPHLTLGRVKNEVKTPNLAESLAEENKKAREPLDSLGPLNINMIALMQSTLTPRGAIYRVLSRHAGKGYDFATGFSA
ncbi:MAG: RNA 2',3'-cyclic phosphodiesterase [PVC group bacterium]